MVLLVFCRGDDLTTRGCEDFMRFLLFLVISSLASFHHASAQDKIARMPEGIEISDFQELSTLGACGKFDFIQGTSGNAIAFDLNILSEDSEFDVFFINEDQFAIVRMGYFQVFDTATNSSIYTRPIYHPEGLSLVSRSTRRIGNAVVRQYVARETEQHNVAQIYDTESRKSYYHKYKGRHIFYDYKSDGNRLLYYKGYALYEARLNKSRIVNERLIHDFNYGLDSQQRAQQKRGGLLNLAAQVVVSPQYISNNRIAFLLRGSVLPYVPAKIVIVDGESYEVLQAFDLYKKVAGIKTPAIGAGGTHGMVNSMQALCGGRYFHVKLTSGRLGKFEGIVDIERLSMHNISGSGLPKLMGSHRPSFTQISKNLTVILVHSSSIQAGGIFKGHYVTYFPKKMISSWPLEVMSGLASDMKKDKPFDMFAIDTVEISDNGKWVISYQKDKILIASMQFREFYEN